eukprot:g11232.t1
MTTVFLAVPGLSDVQMEALLTLGLHQQLLESDQLSAMYTLSKGGGWRGVTFDARTNKRLSKAFGSFGPRRRSSYSKRQSYTRVGSKLDKLEASNGVASMSRNRLTTDGADGNIEVNELASDISVFEFDKEAAEAIIQGGADYTEAKPTLRLVQSEAEKGRTLVMLIILAA